VVVLLPRPSLVGPPFTPLVPTPFHKRQVRGVGDRRAPDQVPADIGAMTGPLVVVGKAMLGPPTRADAALAGSDLHHLQAGERVGSSAAVGVAVAPCGRAGGERPQSLQLGEL